ncbi:M20/M25/M40 family metallo-hydrolase [Nocardia sp. NPDC059239]|uniref:M20/M25/M40 family metallo-hydrolase n=1 Tax=Nocardia sp. NPDC059239 TaxID=3346785 RepID=UPI0036C508E7
MSDQTAPRTDERTAGDTAGYIRAEDEAVRFTSDLIRIDTSNHGSGDACERPAAEYVAERLSEVGIVATILESAIGRSNVVARIEGTDPSRPALLVHGHLDVVPASADDWSVHPFSGDVRDGVIWGRGAVDMKDMDAMILAVARAWAREGRKPVRDIVLAFTADEEDSTAYGSEWLVTEHAGLFEGCTEAITEAGGHRFYAYGQRIYPLGAGERGRAWLRLEARGRAGHGSSPDPENAVARLAAAVARIDAYNWPLRVSPTVRASLEQLADLAGVQLDPDDPALSPAVLRETLGPCAPLVASAIRNSANPTMLSAGYKVNVIPEVAVGHVDGRIVPGGEEEFQATMDALVGPDVTWEFSLHEPAVEAPVDVPVFDAMRQALLAEDPDGRVLPYCSGGGSDNKQFARLGINGYGFVPLGLPPAYDFYAMFHGIDERVPIEALHFGVRVLDRFLSTVH